MIVRCIHIKNGSDIMNLIEESFGSVQGNPQNNQVLVYPIIEIRDSGLIKPKKVDLSTLDVNSIIEKDIKCFYETVCTDEKKFALLTLILHETFRITPISHDIENMFKMLNQEFSIEICRFILALLGGDINFLHHVKNYDFSIPKSKRIKKLNTYYKNIEVILKEYRPLFKQYNKIQRQDEWLQISGNIIVQGTERVLLSNTITLYNNDLVQFLLPFEMIPRFITHFIKKGLLAMDLSFVSKFDSNDITELKKLSEIYIDKISNITESIKCPECSEDIISEFSFCPKCGIQLEEEETKEEKIKS